MTLFQEGFPVSRSALPGSEEAKKMTVISGRKCSALCRNCGPLGLLVKTLLVSSIWHSTRCYLTWKASATPARRLLFRLAPSMPHTGVTDVPLLPTITRFDATCGDLKGKEYTGTKHSMKLIQAVKMWPTPKASDANGSGPVGSKSAEHDIKKGNLKGSVMYYLNDQTGGQLNPTWVEWLMGFPIGWTDLDA